VSTRAAVYCRISRDLTGGNAGVDRQRDACLKLAADRGWTVDPKHIYVENDTSATKGRRPGYQTMVQAAESGAVDVIIAWHVDRLTRKLTELEHLITLSERTGVKVATVSGDLDLTTDSGRLVGRILASVARGEVERKGARQKAANAQRADQGRPPTARAYGYAPDGAVIPEEAAVVATMFEKFAAGASLTSIRTALNREDVLNSRRRPWGPSGVRGILLNPRYTGERWAHGEYVCPGEWEPLVDADTFAAVGARLRDPIRLHGHDGSARKHLGSGLYRCGVCADDTTMVSSWGSWRRTDGSVNKYRVYQCAATPGHLNRKAEPIDTYVSMVIAERLRAADVLTLMDDDRDVAAVRGLRTEANGLRARSDSLAAELADGLLTARQVHVASQRITNRLADVEAKLAAHGQRSALAALAGASDPGVAWASLDVVQRGAVVATLCTVTVRRGARGRALFEPGSVRIEWKGQP